MFTVSFSSGHAVQCMYISKHLYNAVVHLEIYVLMFFVVINCVQGAVRFRLTFREREPRDRIVSVVVSNSLLIAVLFSLHSAQCK